MRIIFDIIFFLTSDTFTIKEVYENKNNKKKGK